MTLEARVFEYLKTKNIRITKHILSVLEIILATNIPVDAKTIHRKLITQDQSIDLSTIHRILDKLHKINLLEALYGERSKFYELSAQFLPHHHHFTCIKCGKIIDIESCIPKPILESISSIGQPVSHTFEIRGICNNCK